MLPLQRRWRFFRNLQDPITLDRIQKRFLYIDDDGNEMWFDATVLASFIKSSGDYRNPLTRKPFNIVEVRRLAKASGIMEILDVEAGRKHRELIAQRDSLRDFFCGELETDLASMFPAGGGDLPLSLCITHMVSTTFPTLAVNCIRILRTDEEFIEDYFQKLFNLLESLREEAISQHRLHGATALQIYERFCRDLEAKCMDRSILQGDRARLMLGGMTISIDLTNPI